MGSNCLEVYACVRFCSQELENAGALTCIFACDLTCTCYCSFAGAGIWTCDGTCKGWEFDGANLRIWFMISNRDGRTFLVLFRRAIALILYMLS